MFFQFSRAHTFFCDDLNGGIWGYTLMTETIGLYVHDLAEFFNVACDVI